jgi:hypothetical protein
MPAGELKKGDCPLIWATIAWTPGTDQIEVRQSRLRESSFAA